MASFTGGETDGPKVNTTTDEEATAADATATAADANAADATAADAAAAGAASPMDAWPTLPPEPAGHPCPLFRPASNTQESAVATFAMG